MVVFIRSLFGIAAALLVLATGTPAVRAGDTLHPLQAELDEQLALWQGMEVADYSYRMQRSCFCVPSSVIPGLVVVRRAEPSIASRMNPDFRSIPSTT